MYSGYFGLILCSYLLYLFLTRMELFLIVSFMLETFSIISQSLTLSNRLSINILAGSLSISSLSLFILFLFSSDYLYFYYVIFLVKSSYSILLYYYLLIIYLYIKSLAIIRSDFIFIIRAKNIPNYY